MAIAKRWEFCERVVKSVNFAPKKVVDFFIIWIAFG
jgi:hypothetical protein